jgi:hypothetical protein
MPDILRISFLNVRPLLSARRHVGTGRHSPKRLFLTLFTRSYGQPICRSLVLAASPQHKHRADSAWRNPADVMLLAEPRMLPTVPFGCKSRPVAGPDREGPERTARIVRDRGRKHLACPMLPQVGCVGERGIPASDLANRVKT